MLKGRKRLRIKTRLNTHCIEKETCLIAGTKLMAGCSIGEVSFNWFCFLLDLQGFQNLEGLHYLNIKLSILNA